MKQEKGKPMMDVGKLPKSGMDRDAGAERADLFRRMTQGPGKPQVYGAKPK